VKLLDHGIQQAMSKHINPKVKSFIETTWYEPESGSDSRSPVTRVVSSAPH
tara:strand:- start:316 stop:468 length:153 start_codon:yes stop_codon:yes gene_type:complete